jgi:hypothetical protein
MEEIIDFFKSKIKILEPSLKDKKVVETETSVEKLDQDLSNTSDETSKNNKGFEVGYITIYMKTKSLLKLSSFFQLDPRHILPDI